MLQIGSKEIFNDLAKLGVIPNKSLILTFPQKLPSNYLGGFVRGYFDGDGTVYFKRHWRKERKKAQWIFRTIFTSGSKNFLNGLKDRLTPFTTGGFIQAKKSGYELVFSQHDSIALFKLMYRDIQGKLYLTRKYRIFQKAILTFYPQMAP